jgi:ribose transport system permease protein
MTATSTSTLTSPAPTRKERQHSGHVLISSFEKMAAVMLLLLLIVVFSIWEPRLFPTSANAQTLLLSQAVTVVIALATMIPLMTGRFDLSVGSNLTLTSIVTAKLMSEHGANVIVAVIAGLVVGALIGALNGFFIACVGVDSLIVTLAVATAATGVIDLYGKGQLVSSDLSPALTGLGNQMVFGLPALFVIAIGIAAIVWYLLVLTPWGRRLRAIGSNENAAIFVGIKVQRAVFVTFVLAGTLGGAAGVLQIAAQGSANPSGGGIPVMLPALAGVFLGATVFTPGRYNVPGTLVGLFVVAVLVNGMALVGADPSVQPIVNGVAVVGAVTASTVLRRRRSGETTLRS